MRVSNAHLQPRARIRRTPMRLASGSDYPPDRRVVRRTRSYRQIEGRRNGYGQQPRLLERSFTASETLTDLASITRARSLAVTQLQITLVSDCLSSLRAKLSEDRREELHDQIERLLYSAAGAIKAELPQSMAGAGGRLCVRKPYPS
jgi:hypothetical protein